jgi:hypothetical protein
MTPARPRAASPEVEMVHRIELPGFAPVLLNQLLHCHWAVAAKRKKAWTRTIGLFSDNVPRAAGKRRVSLVVTLPPRGRKFDPDAPWKALLDALVRLGLLVDDSPKWVELGSVTFERGPSKATTIILEDID